MKLTNTQNKVRKLDLFKLPLLQIVEREYLRVFSKDDLRVEKNSTWDPWILGLLDLLDIFPPPPPPHTSSYLLLYLPAILLLWYGFIWGGELSFDIGD